MSMLIAETLHEKKTVGERETNRDISYKTSNSWMSNVPLMEYANIDVN